jgi:hypothetical protein
MTESVMVAAPLMKSACCDYREIRRSCAMASRAMALRVGRRASDAFVDGLRSVR